MTWKVVGSNPTASANLKTIKDIVRLILEVLSTELKLKKERAAKAVIRKKEKVIKDAAKKKRLEAERYQEFLEMKKEYENK